MTSARSATKTLALAAILSATAVLPLATPAGADDLVSIPVSGVHRGAQGTTATVATVNIPAELVGQTCSIVGQTINQRSVHPGNDLLIVTNGRTFVIPDFEDEGDVVHDAGEVGSVGDTIELLVRFGPDGASSGGFKVSLTCDEAAFPETPAPDTTAPVTEPDADADPAGPAVADEPVDVTAPTTAVPTTTVPTTAGPTTAVPDTAAPTSTIEPAAVAATDVTTPRTTAMESPAPAPAQLPVTGSTTWWIIAAGLALAGSGAALVRRAKIESVN